MRWWVVPASSQRAERGSRIVSCVLWLQQTVKLERLPEYLRDTVDWFMGKARRREREGECGGGGGCVAGGSAGVPGGAGEGGAGAGVEVAPYLRAALLERQLPELDLRQLVELPRGLDLNEWLASHTLALFEHVNVLYGCVSEWCTGASCPETSGPGGRVFAWADERGKKARLAAPQYVDCVMTTCARALADEALFPSKAGARFPARFPAELRRVLALLWRVLAHLYAAHFPALAALRLHPHLHLTFAHFTHLDRAFRLLDPKDTELLRDLEEALHLRAPPSPPPAPPTPLAPPDAT